jgi:hypothetical protein
MFRQKSDVEILQGCTLVNLKGNKDPPEKGEAEGSEDEGSEDGGRAGLTQRIGDSYRFQRDLLSPAARDDLAPVAT